MLNFFNPKISSFGLDLSDLSIKIANVKKRGPDFCLTSFGRQEIKEGLIENGEIKKEAELIAVIKESVQKVIGEPLETDYCVASLPETFSFIQVIKMPLMDQEELTEAMKWELEAHIPLSKDEIYYDWQILNNNSRSHEDHLDVLLGVLPKKTVDPYLDVLKKAELKPLIFEIEPIATTRALMKNGYSQDPTIIIDLGAKRTSLFIFYGQAIYFTTELPISNFLLVNTLSQKLDITLEKARQIKFKVGLNIKHPNSRVYKELGGLMLETVEKIKNYINFYNDHIMIAYGNNKNIKKLILCGGGALMADLPEFLSNELDLSVEIGNPWINICNSQNNGLAKFPQKESLSFATAFGLAIRNNND